MTSAKMALYSSSCLVSHEWLTGLPENKRRDHMNDVPIPQTVATHTLADADLYRFPPVSGKRSEISEYN